MTIRDTVVSAPGVAPPADPAPARHARGWAGLVGPFLVVSGVLVVLHGFAFGGLITTEDLRRLWLPVFCFLGRGLQAGHLPGWTANVFGGTPFAADPQSGWMDLPAMTLFTTLPCAAAIRWMVVVQPVLGGLGLYAFLRAERCGRPAAASGALVLALAISGAELSTSLPFAATLAWTALSLAACARYVRAPHWPGRLGWCAGAALAWGQLAASHFSVGLIIGTMSVVAYLAVAPWRPSGAPPTSRGRAALGVVGRLTLLAGAAVALNLAFLLPRVALIPEVSLGQGYAALDALNRQIAGLPPAPAPIGNAAGPLWPLKLATFGGAYLGAAALALSFAGAWDRRRRRLWVAFASLAVATWALSLHAVAAAVPPTIRSWRLVDLYLHSPEWFAFGTLLALAVLAGLGIEAWIGARSAPRRVAMLAPGVLLWLVAPAFGAPVSDLAPVWAAAGVAAVALALTARRRWLAWLVPAALAVELVVNGVTGDPLAPMPFGPVPKLLRALPQPTVDPAADLVAGPLMRALAGAGGRYLTVAPGDLEERDLGDVYPDQALLFDVESTGGYNAVQLLRPWVFVRAVQGRSVRYNRSTFGSAPPLALDLLDVHAVVVGQGAARPVGPTLAEQDGLVALGVTDPPARASLVTSWRVVGDDPRVYPNRALDGILDPGFDPERTAILERDPGLGAPGGGPGTATYRVLGDRAARIEVDSAGGGVVVVRTPWERGWRAEVDGTPADVLRADYLLQGVAVPPGHHVVDLRYEDPAIGYGLAGSAAAAAAMAAAWAVAWRRRRTRPDETPEAADADAGDTDEGAR